MVADWTLYEWKRRVAFLEEILDKDDRLKKWSASRVFRAANGRIALKCDSLCFEFDDETGEAYIWRQGQRYGGGKMLLSDLNYLRDVIEKWVEEQKTTPIPRYMPIDKRHKEIWHIPKTTDARKKKRNNDGE